MRFRQRRSTGADAETVRGSAFDATHAADLSAPQLRHAQILSAGTRLASARLQIRRLIGRGGMGLVYEAFDSERGTLVALKTLSDLDAAGIYRLKHEFRVLQEVSHPNLVQLFELFADKDAWFFTMELVIGEPFDSWVRNGGSYDEPRLRAALAQVALAVKAIHAAGKLHRDLKPSNVLVDALGRVTLLDFGLAIDPEQSIGQTVGDHSWSGTPAYMAPEQAAGANAGPASDVYAIGAMLFEALTGRLPFEGAFGAILAAKQTERAPDVHAFCPSAPEDLRALCQVLLAAEPSARPDSATLATRLTFANEPQRESRTQRISGINASQLCGRVAELAQLRAAYAESLAGSAVVMLVAGESGIGKSALVDTLLSELRREAHPVVLQGRCYERERVPFKAFDSLVDDLSRFLRRIGREQAQSLLPRDVFALARLFPVLDRVDVVAEAPRKAVGDVHELRRRAFAALSELLGRMRDRWPLVLAIDDLQWLDADSALLLRFLLESTESCPLLFIVGFRDDNLSANLLLCEVILAARRNPFVATRELELRPLAAPAAQALAERLLGAGTGLLAAQVAAEAQGSPFFVLELARQAARGDNHTPLTLDNCLLDRIRQQSPEARRLLSVVAVAARPISHTLAVRASNASHATIDLLCSEQLLRRAGGAFQASVECYHDRIRETACSALAVAALRDVHQALVIVLLEDQAADHEQLAFHCEGAGDQLRAAHYALRAADAAHAALAFDRAAELYRIALKCTPTVGAEAEALQLKLAAVLSDGGRGAEAAPLFMAAAEHAAAAPALELRRRAAEQWLVSGRVQEGLDAFRQVLAAVGLRLPASPRRALVDVIWVRALLWLRGLGFEERTEAQIPAAELLRIDACKTAWSLSFGNTIQVAAFQARYLWYALRAGEPQRIALALGMEAVYASMSGNSARMQALMRASDQLASRLPQPQVQAFTHLTLGQCSYLSADWADACKELAHAEELLVHGCQNVSYELNTVRYFWGNALVFRGCFRELGVRLSAWLKDAQWRGDLYASATLRLLRARSITLASGDVDAAEREIEDALLEWRAPEFGVQQFLAYVTQVQVDLYCGRAESALERSAELVAKFSKSLMSRIQICRVPAHQHAAYAALAMAEIKQDLRWLARAERHARRLRRERIACAGAMVQQIEATSAFLRGDRARAAQQLELAAASFERTHMHFYAAAMRSRLGSLRGDKDGALMSAAAAVFQAEGVVNPARFVAMLTPGLRALD